MTTAARLLPPTSSGKQTMSSPPSPSPLPRKSNISPAPSLVSLCSVMDAPVNIKLRYKDVAKYLIWAECPLDESSAALHNKGFVDFISTSPTNPKTSATSSRINPISRYFPNRRPSAPMSTPSTIKNKIIIQNSKVCVIS